MTALVIVEVVVAAAAYLGAAHAVWRDQTAGRGALRARALAALALVVQPLALIHMAIEAGHLVIGVGTALSLFAWQVALLVWLFSWSADARSANALALAIYPLAALCVVTGVLVPDADSAVETLSWAVQAHILLSMLAYGLLTLGAVQAGVLAIQHQALRRRPPSPMFDALPPIETMEAVLFRLIGSGFLLLSLAIATGALFISHLFEQHLAHKAVLSVIAWIVFAIVLAGRFRYGWRGRVAVTGVIAGYSLLVLAYFGSKLVLELILGIHW